MGIRRLFIIVSLLLCWCGTLKAQTSDATVITVENEDGQGEIKAEFTYYYDSDTNHDDAYDLYKELGKFLVQVIEEIRNNHNGVKWAKETFPNGDKRGRIESESEYSLTFNFSIYDKEVYGNDSSHTESLIEIVVDEQRMDKYRRTFEEFIKEEIIDSTL